MTTDTFTPEVAPADVAAPNGSWPKDVPTYETTPKKKKKRKQRSDKGKARKPKLESSTTDASAASCVRPVEVTPAAVVEPSAGVRSFERVSWLRKVAEGTRHAVGLDRPDPTNSVMVRRTDANLWVVVGAIVFAVMSAGAALAWF